MAFVSTSAFANAGRKGCSVCSAERRLRTGRSRARVVMMAEDEAEEEAPSDTYVPTTSEQLEPLSTEGRLGMVNKLLEVCAITDRGQTATDEQKAVIEDLVASLEAQNPNQTPVESDEIDGAWNLVYVSAPFYKTNPLLAMTASPFLTVGQVRQIISVESGELLNEVDVIAFPMISGTVATTARILPVGSERLELTLETASLKGDTAFERFNLSALKVDIPVEEIYQNIRGSLPEAFLDTYYLDDQIRISRGKGSKLFIFTKL